MSNSSPPVKRMTVGFHTPQRSGRSSFPTLPEAFSDDAIIRELAKWRIRIAQRRNMNLFLHRMRATRLRDAPKPNEELFPPRRLWHKRRMRKRATLSGAQVNLDALIRTMQELRRQDKPPLWARALDAFIRRVQERALREEPFLFAPPVILPSPRSPGNSEYRPLAMFNLEDKIIGCIAARYLRQCFDPVLDKASMAFRCAADGGPAPRHHDAVRKIINIRRRHKGKDLYVAECDIRGFFDSVDHQLASRAVRNVADEAERKQSGLRIDPRAFDIFNAYLDCYTFPRNVKRWSEPQLKESHPKAFFKWPEEDLRKFHATPMAAAIGVPQGGALSTIVANCVLHKADKALRRLARESRPTFTYLRYCDDMIIIAPDRKVCANAFNLYCSEAEAAGLPLHPPEKLDTYPGDFWGKKSRAPYRWGSRGRRRRRTVPWIQFVGYQIRYDGFLRVRPESVARHRTKIVHEIGELLAHLHQSVPAGVTSPPVRKSGRQIGRRLRMRLLSRSIGRRTLQQDLDGPLPMSWCAGFVCLYRQPFIISQMKALDRHREQQIHRVARALARLKTGSMNAKHTEVRHHSVRFHGYPFSYVAQFQGGNTPRNTGRIPCRH